MTKISYIAGAVPTNEFADRANQVTPLPYFNPLTMTDGQAYLTLMRDQAITLAQYYPENKTYRKALALIATQLNKGVNGFRPYYGVVDRSLYPVARAIDMYHERRQPAVLPNVAKVAGSWTDESLIAGEVPTPDADFLAWWWSVDSAYLKTKGIKTLDMLRAWADKYINKLNLTPEQNAANQKVYDAGPRQRRTEFQIKYDTLKYIVNLYNTKLDTFAHHPLYSFLPQRNQYPPSVVTKNILHSAGVQGMAQVGDFSTQNMALWTRNSILRSNIAGGVGALSPERTAFALSGLPESEYGAFLGTSVNPVGSATKWKSVGDPVSASIIVAIIGLLGTAVTAAMQWLKEAQAKREAAMASVQGWGTQAFSANETDWDGYTQKPIPSGGSDLSTPLLIGGGALALWALNQK